MSHLGTIISAENIKDEEINQKVTKQIVYTIRFVIV